ncbi:MAG: hypothetical protein C4518_07130 [Desulfobacteraceae bacterium]|nr:MAG: hypothetical protein C4518_07130 [Desulfobacteraceae bacterium]
MIKLIRLTIQILAVVLLGFASPAMARLSSVDLYPKNLQKYGFTVNSSNADGTVQFQIHSKAGSTSGGRFGFSGQADTKNVHT